ncbi:MAG: hypothetical protein A4E74_02329 [Syntrophus sp. PtaB.Bin075]|nr:MAG: hypothetical protein A4E74_02329 [Syntrophus sp. PtaB.Bin075]
MDQRPILMEMFRSCQAGIAQVPDRLFHGIEGVDLAGQDAEFRQLMAGLRQNGPCGISNRAVFALSEQLTNGHPVFGERARLVNAQYCGRAERFNRRYAPGEHALLRNAPGPQGQKDSQDNRKFFGKSCHGQGDAGQKPMQPVPSRQAIDDNDQGAKGESQDGKIANQSSRLPLQKGFFRLNVLKGSADLSDFSVNADRLYLRDALTLHRQGSRIDKGQIIAAGPLHSVGAGSRRLPHRNGFSGKQGFVHQKAEAGEQHGIGWNAVPLFHDQDVSPNHLPSRNPPFGAIPDHQGAGAGKITQRLQGPLRLALLIQRDSHDDEHETEQHQRFMDITQEKIDDAAGHQQKKHRFPNDFEGDGPDAALSGRGQFIITLLL